MCTPLVAHPFADGFRKISSGSYALVDTDGNTVDIVDAAKMAEIVADDDAAYLDMLDSEAPHVAAGIL